MNIGAVFDAAAASGSEIQKQTGEYIFASTVLYIFLKGDTHISLRLEIYFFVKTLHGTIIFSKTKCIFIYYIYIQNARAYVEIKFHGLLFDVAQNSVVH